MIQTIAPYEISVCKPLMYDPTPYITLDDLSADQIAHLVKNRQFSADTYRDWVIHQRRAHQENWGVEIIAEQAVLYYWAQWGIHLSESCVQEDHWAWLAPLWKTSALLPALDSRERREGKKELRGWYKFSMKHCSIWKLPPELKNRLGVVERRSAS